MTRGSPDRVRNTSIRRRTIVSFAVFACGIAAAVFGWMLLAGAPQDNEIPWPLRRALSLNAKMNRTLFGARQAARQYEARDAAQEPRVNGDIGLGEDFDPGEWTLAVQPHPGTDSLIRFSMRDLRTLPYHEVIFDFKCIEGWSQVTRWGGALFVDFLVRNGLGTRSGRPPDPAHPEDLYRYAGLLTPDSAYYVGLDMASMLHPQTLLCYEVNGHALPMEQGFPLRLLVTVKYGIKSLKRIGTIFFSDVPPPDYWYERGYDYDAAL